MDNATRMAVRDEVRAVLESKEHHAVLRGIFFDCWEKISDDFLDRISRDAELRDVRHKADCSAFDDIEQIKDDMAAVKNKFSGGKLVLAAIVAGFIGLVGLIGGIVSIGTVVGEHLKHAVKP